MRFAPSHEWVELEGSIATVGISKFAQKELGDIVYVELPKVGTKLKASEEACVLESTKAAVDIYTPVGGEVVETNLSLREHPEWVNNSPEKEGWLFKLKCENEAEFKALLSEADYRKEIEIL